MTKVGLAAPLGAAVTPRAFYLLSVSQRILVGLRSYYAFGLGRRVERFGLKLKPAAILKCTCI